MKRSQSIRLLLLGGLSAGALTGCDPPAEQQAISTTDLFTNNHYVPGVGYYHAPFRGWYPRRYNDYDPQGLRYYYGGQWGPAPHVSVINLSSPTAEAASMAATHRSDVPRRGFGTRSYSHSIWS